MKRPLKQKMLFHSVACGLVIYLMYNETTNKSIHDCVGFCLFCSEMDSLTPCQKLTHAREWCINLTSVWTADYKRGTATSPTSHWGSIESSRRTTPASLFLIPKTFLQAKKKVNTVGPFNRFGTSRVLGLGYDPQCHKGNSTIYATVSS